MGRTVTIASGVTEHLGAEQVARLRGPQWAQPVQCWQCDQWIPTDHDAAVLFLRVAELLDEPRRKGSSFALWAHPDCLSSQVLVLTLEQIRAHRAALAAAGAEAGPAEDTDDVQVVATTIPTPQGDAAYPAVLVSFRVDLALDEPDMTDRVDLVAAALIGYGWHPITTLAAPPAPGPDGYRVRFRYEGPGAAAPGVVEVIDPLGQIETSARVDPDGWWRPSVEHLGATVLLLGSQYLVDWANTGLDGVRDAVRAGTLVGGLVPVELVGPGHDVDQEEAR